MVKLPVQKFQHIAWYEQHHRLSRDHAKRLLLVDASNCNAFYNLNLHKRVAGPGHVTQTGSIDILKVAMHIVLIRVVPIVSERRPVRNVHQPTNYDGGGEMTPGRVHICTRSPQPSGKVDGASGPHRVPMPIYQLAIIQGLYTQTPSESVENATCYSWCETPFAVFRKVAVTWLTLRIVPFAYGRPTVWNLGHPYQPVLYQNLGTLTASRLHRLGDQDHRHAYQTLRQHLVILLRIKMSDSAVCIFQFMTDDRDRLRTAASRGVPDRRYWKACE